jgi:hypothetical protein
VITVRPAPRREPPFDDELAEAGVPRIGRLDQPLPFPEAVLKPVHISPPRGNLPDPVPWARRLMMGVVEVSAGKRPMQQLAGMLAPSILAGLRADFAEAAGRRHRHWLHTAAVRTVVGCEPAAGIAELSATLHTPSRVHAVALRAEVHHGLWRCVRLQLG